MAADQTLLALCRAEDRIGRMIVADSWRWMPGVALRSLQARGSGNVVGDRVTLVRPSRLRRRDPTTVPALRRSYRRYDRHSRTPCPALCAGLARGGYLQSVRGGLLPAALGFECDVLRTG